MTTMTGLSRTQKMIDKVIEDNQNACVPMEPKSCFRNHLGASLIGRECSRELWYTFRWALKIKFNARILRLFARGHLEEDRFIFYLREAGIKVWTRDANGAQFRMKACNGHFGGSMDGVGKGFPEVPDLPVLLEFKTHNDKSFNKLVKEGLKAAKPEHETQCQCYMGGNNLKFAAYYAVNKNTDEWHTELVPFEENMYKLYISRADYIINQPYPPDRAFSSRADYRCKFCNYQTLCWLRGTEPAINCRTCKHSVPYPEGKWWCNQKKRFIVNEEMHLPCNAHSYIEGLVL